MPQGRVVSVAHRQSRGLALLAFFVSGAAGLVYEICWIRQAALIFGSTTLAVSTVVAIFFLGLAIGTEVFGRLAVRSSRPLLVLALLEVGVACTGLLSLQGFRVAEALHGEAFRWLGAESGDDGALVVIRLALLGLILLPPTVLMGGTLPLFCRQFVSDPDRIARSVGFLYGLNTLGAALGCVATGVWLLPSLGLWGSVSLAVGLDLLVALAFFAAARGLPLAPARISPAALAAAPPGPERPGLVQLLVFLGGFVALGSEVLWARFVALLVENSVHTYTLTLGIVLAGIFLGAQLARAFDDIEDRARLYGALQVAVGIVMLALMLLPPAFWDGLTRDAVFIYCVLLLPPAVLQGASFPLAVRLFVVDPREASSGVGRIAAFSTLGGIAGSLLVGFVGLPGFGMQAMTLALSGLSLLLGALAWLGFCPRGRRRDRLVWVATAAALWFALPLGLPTRLPADYLGRDGELVGWYEGRSANVSVVRREGTLYLRIDELWQGLDARSPQSVAAHIPMLLHPDPHRVLVVGTGAGQAPARFLYYPIEALFCVDIEARVFDAIRDHFDASWLEDPRTHLVQADGRSFLAHGTERFDVISMELGQINRPGVPFFYTVDLYQRVRARLAPGGIVSQFLPLQYLSAANLRAVVASFTEVFPQSFLWFNGAESLLIGSEGSELSVGVSRLGLLRSDARIRDDLDFRLEAGAGLPLHDPDVFLGGLLLGPEGLRALGDGGERLTDDRPILDYAVRSGAIRSLFELKTVPVIEGLLEPTGLARHIAGPFARERVDRVRERNLRGLRAAALQRGARFESVPSRRIALLERSLRQRDRVETRWLLAEAYVHVRDFERAIAVLEGALALRPEDPNVQHALARVLEAAGLAGVD